MKTKSLLGRVRSNRVLYRKGVVHKEKSSGLDYSYALCGAGQVARSPLNKDVTCANCLKKMEAMR